MVRRGDVTPTELVELYLDRIERLDPELNSYRVVLGDRARADASGSRSGWRTAAATAAARRASRSQSRTPRTSRARSPPGAPPRSTSPPSSRRRDGPPVARCRRGRDRQDEPAGARDLRLHREPRPGESRATRGTPATPRAARAAARGAAVAAGLCAGASASDGAGSIRIPAALYGLFGLKPQRDRISLAPLRRALARALGHRLRLDPLGHRLGALARRLPRAASPAVRPPRPSFIEAAHAQAREPASRLLDQAAAADGAADRHATR